MVSQAKWPRAWSAPLVSQPCFSEQGEVSYFDQSALIDEKSDWNDPSYAKLWLYNLHYLDELNSIGSDSRQVFLTQLIQLWINANPPLQGNGWEPYPLSLRIVNLVKWFARQQDPIPQHLLNSLFVQTQALSKQLEHHILGNHLFANGKALVFAGSFLHGRMATQWMHKGLQILDKEIKEQFLSDGGHFELSPMYHASLLWDLCDLVNLANCTNSHHLLARMTYWKQVISRGAQWLQAMLHPDKGISFFNDAAFGIAPEWDDIKKYSLQLDIHIDTEIKPLNWLDASGYCIITPGTQSKVILDLARIGPDYQPGHAHADSLSFEMSLFGQRFLVNSGTSQYGEGSQRHFERSTIAHNTVSINRENSSEVWGGFRVARRAYPKDIKIEKLPDRISIAASHTGYKRLAGRNIHRREWGLCSNQLQIIDSITGSFDEAVARLYFHPAIKLSLHDNRSVLCTFPHGERVLVRLDTGLKVNLIASFWYPEFGKSVENHCLELHYGSGGGQFTVLWDNPDQTQSSN